MKSITESLQEYARGITGGLLFSLPLLFTMEIWWAGFVLHSFHLIMYVIFTFLLLLGYNRYAGVHEGASWKEVIIDSFEEIGIGFCLSFFILWQLGRINFSEMNHDEIMGKIILETMTVAIGVSVGTAQLGGEDPMSENESSSKENDKTRKIDIVGQLVLSFCGAILIAGNIAPTEEIPMIAFEMNTSMLIIIMIESMLLGAVILFYSSFKGSHVLNINGVLTTIIFQTCMVYSIALISTAIMLWFFGRLDNVYFEMAIRQVIILGLPAMLGASAGRLLIK